MHYHFVARTNGKATPFSDPKKAHWAWHRLKRAFPDTLAAVLMPNHLHLVLKSDAPHEIRTALARILGRFTFVFGEMVPFWQPVPPPTLITQSDKLRRDIRYVLLNPCRARLCKDPLEWKWSTHRGSIGAATHPWVSQQSLTATLGGTLEQVHKYITSDPSVSLSGSSLPSAMLASKTPQRSLEDITNAAFAAAEELPDLSALQLKKSKVRALFVRLACHQGWGNAHLLARYLQISYSTAWDLLRREKGRECTAAALCLGDARLSQICEVRSRSQPPK